MKNIKIKDYFEIVKPKYIFYKIIPLKSLRNYNSDKIINAVTHIYKTVSQRIVKDNKKYFFSVPSKMSYYIFMQKGKVEFFFIIPADYETLLKNKIIETWQGVTIEKVDSLPLFDDNTIKCSLTYSKNDALSLSTDKRSNILLSSLMNTMHVLNEDDKIGVIYNFIPCSQSYWREESIDALKRFKEGYPTDREKADVIYLVKLMGRLILSVLETVCETITELFGEKIIPTELTPRNIDLLPETRRKTDNLIVKSQIVVLSQSKNIQVANNNCIGLCDAFKCISGDNELIAKKLYKPIDLTECYLKGAETIKMSSNEGQNLIALPGKELIEEHQIPCIEVFESIVPDQLRKGVVSMGVSSYRGSSTGVYLCNDFELRNLALCITGSNRSGKSTLISNIANNCLKSGESVVLLDFCGKCNLSELMNDVFPKNKVLNINCADFNTLQGLGYNEIDIDETDLFKRYRNAKMQSIQLLTLINGINDEDRMLKAKMDRFLEAASLCVFMCKGSIKDVFSVLQNHKVRQEFISKVPENQKEYLQEYLETLDELNERNRENEIVGTKYNYISGIIDRLTALKKNSYIELMLKKDCTNNINLLDEIQKNQIICIQMPESMFSTSAEKDIYSLYWVSKLWLTLQIRASNIDRKDHVKLNIIVDEIYQTPHTQGLIAEKLSQMPKFTAKMIVTCHYLNQIEVLRKELRASNASYMLLQGSNTKNFDDLKLEFENLGFTVDDLLNMERYHSLNLLSYEEGYWAGITALPKPLK